MKKFQKITATKILALILLVSLFFGLAFNIFNLSSRGDLGKTQSYLSNNGAFMGVITLGGHQLKILQTVDGEEKDCKESGVDLGTNYIATDKHYNIDSVYIKNTDAGTDLSCYLRWKFVATIDGVQDIDINKYCNTSNPYIFLNKEDNYFYYVDTNFNPKSLASSETTLLFDEMYFKGEYNSESKTYGSVIDEYFSGSDFKLKLILEASDTEWTVNKPTAKFTVQGATISESLDFVNPYTLTLPEGYETIVVDGQTLYFQCWTRNGSGMFLPGNTVTLEQYDEFEAVYSANESAISATTLAYTPAEDGSGYAITGLNSNMELDNGNLVISNFSEDQEITVIEDNAFKGVKTISTVSAQNSSITSIGAYAFHGCTNITTVTLPDTIEIIGNQAFGQCYNLREIVIPEGVTSIGSYAFTDCYKLTSITLPSTITELKTAVFQKCSSLDYLYIPAGISAIDWAVFLGCVSLSTFEVDPANQSYSSDGPTLYNKNKTQIIAYPTASGNYVVPDTVTSIYVFAFSMCNNLTSVTIHENVTSIGVEAFNRDYLLTNIIVDENNPKYSAENGILYNKDKTVLEAWPSASGVVTIPETVSIIGERVFNSNTYITEVIMGDSVESIGGLNFSYSTNLAKITFGANVEKIAPISLNTCKNLTEIVFVDPTGWWITSNTNYTGGSEVTVDLSDSATAIEYFNSYHTSYWYKVD